MKFGVREVCDVIFKAKTNFTLGKRKFAQGEPVLYIDTATASTLEHESTTVYAVGGKGNSRLIAWDGEKTLTFTVTDALMSARGISLLTNANLIKQKGGFAQTNVPISEKVYSDSQGLIDLSHFVPPMEATISNAMPVLLNECEANDEIGDLMPQRIIADIYDTKIQLIEGYENRKFYINCYFSTYINNVSEIQLVPEELNTNFYVEAHTLFRKQADGKDIQAIFTLPNVKIQSNISFTMEPTGDPSTFNFTMDAMPGYTFFDKSKKVLCVLQVLDGFDMNDFSVQESRMKVSEDQALAEESERTLRIWGGWANTDAERDGFSIWKGENSTYPQSDYDFILTHPEIKGE